MDRFLYALMLCALLALAPVCAARQRAAAQPVFFSTLFPQLMPQAEIAAWLADWLGGAAGEAVAL